MQHHAFATLSLALLGSTLCAQWQVAAPAAAPAARYGHGLCYDATLGRALLYGGSAGFSTSSETWSCDGSTWVQLAPAASPGGKTGIDLAHDPVRGVTVLYGGLNTSFFGGPSVDQTWEFDGTTWTQVFPTTTPGGLGNYGMCYDSNRQRVVLYGGSANSFFPIAEAGTWEWNGTNWALVTTTGSPGPLERPAMCYHAGLQRTVLFGGIDPQVGGNDTTWLYDGTSWVAAPVSGPRPPARSGAEMAYDTVRGVCVLTGGVDPTTGTAIVDTWEFDGAAWTPVASTTTARYGHAVAFLPTSRQVLLFGGLNPANFQELGDTWLYGAASRAFGSGCAGSNGVPTLAANGAPRLGATFTLNLGNLAAASSAAFLAFGWSDQQGPFGALPLPLAGFGMPGCTALVSGEALLLVPAAAGAATWSLPLPNQPVLAGLVLFHQGVSIDPAANAAGLVTSNGHAGLVGF